MTATSQQKTLEKNTNIECEKPDPLYVRTVADELGRHLERSNTSVHWVSPAGGEVSWGPPKLTWPALPCLGYVIEHGSNEGIKVTVKHSESARDPEHGKSLIVIKLLTGIQNALKETALVVDFLNNMKPDEMLKLQQEREKKEKRRH